MFPKRLKIGGLWYKVKYLSDLTEVAGSNCSGLCAYREQILFVNRDQAKDALWVTLIHEIIHAINTEVDERETEYLAQAIYQVLKDNHLCF